MAAARRVLLLNYEFPPLGGGAANASYQIAQRLAAAGHRVDAVTSGTLDQAATEECDGIRVHRVHSLRRGIQDSGLVGAWSYLMPASRLCQRLARREAYDLVHCFFGLPTGALCLFTPALRGLPSVVSLRGSDVPGYDPGDPTLRLGHALLAPVSRRVWRRADAVVANSEALRELAQGFLPDLGIDCIPNGVDPAFLAPRPPGGSGPRVRLLCVARFVRRKGIDDLLRAAALLGDAPFELVLQGSGREETPLRRLASELGLGDRVRFEGYRRRDTLPEVYGSADVFVLPSHSESCAMALLEAMGAGLPLVATRVGGSRELVEHEVNGLLVPPRDPSALAAALRRLIEQPELRRRLGSSSAERGEVRHSWDAVSAAYAQVYERVLKQRCAA